MRRMSLLNNTIPRIRGIWPKGIKIPFNDNLAFDWTNRVDGKLTVNERISDGVDNAEIVGGYRAYFDGVSNIEIESIRIDSGESINFCFELTAPNDSPLLSSRIFTPTRYSYITLIYGTRISLAAIKTDDTAPLIASLTEFSTLTANTLYNCHLELNGTIATLTINGITSIHDYGVPVYFLFNKIGAYTSSFTTGYISDIVSDDAVYYLNGNIKNSLNGITATNNGVTFQLNNKDQLPFVQEALNYGFYHEISTGIQVIKPQYTLPAGWVSYAGGTDVFHNGINSFKSTNPTGNLDPKFDILDRINQTIDSTNSIYYDSTNRITRSTYYLGLLANELHQDVINNDTNPYMQVADVDKAFAQMKANYASIQQMSRFSLYITQKVGDGLDEVLKFINYL